MSDVLRYVSKADIPEKLYLVGLAVGGRPIAGGFSDVFRGTFEETGQEVAIKRMRYTVADDAVNKQLDTALEKEVTMLMKLKKHPNIVRFLGLVKHEETPCIVTLWAPKGPLAKCDLKKMSLLDKKRIIIEVASALAFLHSGNAYPDGTTAVAHGDLHPDNVFIGKNGAALLADFGLCKVIPQGLKPSTSLRPGAPQGRIAYVAPELHDEGLRGVESDVFAFGMLAYEVLGGNLSALGKSHVKITTAITNGVRPDYLEVEGMGDVWSLVSNCWEGSPGKRPSMNIVCKGLGEKWPDAAAAAATLAATSVGAGLA